jgi:hypothetical protein
LSDQNLQKTKVYNRIVSTSCLSHAREGLMRPSSRSRFTLLVFLPAIWLWSPAAYAQGPPHISVVDGYALLERGGSREPAIAGLPLAAGDRVSTTSARVEVMFPDGSVLDLDEYSSADFETTDSPISISLTSGRLLLRVAGPAGPTAASRFEVRTPVSSMASDGPGQYRASYPEPLSAAAFDELEQWAQAYHDERFDAGPSASYLPPDLRAYGATFDRYGAWQYDPPYGHVWFPTVAADWRPYYHGYWTSLAPYGWTWVGLDRWGWPTHHYGRWGYKRNRWFWIPGTDWGPAWVTWASAPGYVSWCPIGIDNRPVFSLTVNIGHAWTGWVVVPRDHFGARHALVDRHAIAGHRLAPGVRFVEQRRGSSTTAPRAVAIERPRAAPRPRAALQATGRPPYDRTTFFRRQPAAPQRPLAVERQRPTAPRRPQSLERRPPSATRAMPPVVGRRNPSPAQQRPSAQAPVSRPAIPRGAAGTGTASRARPADAASGPPPPASPPAPRGGRTGAVVGRAVPR